MDTYCGHHLTYCVRLREDTDEAWGGSVKCPKPHSTNSISTLAYLQSPHGCSLQFQLLQHREGSMGRKVAWLAYQVRRVICCITSSWQLWTSDNVPIHARSQEAMWGSATMATVDTFSASPPSSLFVKKHIYDPRCPPKPPFPPLLIILHLFEILQIFPPERVYEHPRMCME